MSVLAYEAREGESPRVWNAGNVSLVIGTALILSIWIVVPTLSLGPARVRELLVPVGIPLFLGWVLGPLVGAAVGIYGVVRRVGGVAMLGVVVNVLCWPVLVLVCWVCLMRGR